MKKSFFDLLKRSPLDLVLIVGPDTPDVAELEKTYQKLKKEKGFSYKVIGDGKNQVTEGELAALQGRLGSNTRVDIAAHGAARNKEHKINLMEGGGKPTAEIFTKLNMLAAANQTQGMQVHLWSCSGGAAAKDYAKLPAGAVFMAHASDEHVSLIAISMDDIAKGVMRHHPSKSPEEATSHSLKEYAMSMVTSPEMLTMRYREIIHTARAPDVPLSKDATKRWLEIKQGEYARLVSDKASSRRIKAITDHLLPITDDALAAYAKNACMIQVVRGNDAYVEKYMKQPGRHPDTLVLSHGRTALGLAALNGHAGVVEVLARAGADLNQIDRDGWTVLGLAAYKGHIGVVDVLVKAGADINQVDGNGRTALALAATKKHGGVVEILRRTPAEWMALLDKSTPKSAGSWAERVAGQAQTVRSASPER